MAKKVDPYGRLRIFRWRRIAFFLVLGTMVYNILESLVALWAGLVTESISLFGFGLDSVIEILAAATMLWRMSVEAPGEEGDAIEAAEARARKIIGWTFILLSTYVLWSAFRGFWSGKAPESALWGIGIAIASLLIMPLVSWAKLRAAKIIGSRSLRAEAMETLACTYLSASMLIGLLGYHFLGWWWLDSATALAMVPWLIHEGYEGIQGESE